MDTRPPEDVRLLFDAIPAGVVALDREYRIVACTDAYVRHAGRPREHMLGHVIFDVFTDSDANAAEGARALRDALGRVRSTGIAEEMPVMRYDVDGPDGFSSRWWMSVVTPVLDADGVVTHLLQTVEEVTEHVLAARERDETALVAERLQQAVVRRTAQLRAANAALRRSDEAKGELLSRVSHELRTPLSAIQGFAELLADGALSPQDAERARLIRGAAEHLGGLVDDLLDITQLDAGRLSPRPEPVELRGMVHDVVEVVRAAADSAGVVLSAPAATGEPVVVLADPQRLRQILVNLVGNAVRHNTTGTGAAVRLADTGDGAVRVEVVDDGPGLPEGQLARVFEPFERATDRGDGLGLGLALSQRLAAAMGTVIDVRSAPGQGSTFGLVLPRAADGAGRPASTGGTPATAPPATGGTVLYVEDTRTNTMLMEAVMRKRPGLDLVVATDGAAGLAAMTARTVDLVVLDLHLPDMPGNELLRRMRAAHGVDVVPPVVVLTADATPATREALLADGVAAFLTKPLRTAEFLALVDTLLADASPAVVPPGGASLPAG